MENNLTRDRVPLTQIEVADYDLGLRGKLARSSKTRKSPSGLTFCTIIYGLSLLDDVTDTPFSSASNGYPDAVLTPDESTRIDLPWRPGIEAVIADLTGPDGRPLPMSPRGVLQKLNDGYNDLGLQPVLGYEYEVWVFNQPPTGAAGAVIPPGFGRTENAYSLTRCAEINELAAEFIDRMDRVGICIEMFHAELGPGFYEFTMAPTAAPQAADNAARARQYFRDLCAERGLHASFMSKPFADKSGAGGHIHSSLNRDGVNIFAGADGGMSKTAQHYLAGLLAGMADTTLMLNPQINSYKRIDPEMYTPTTATWGHDDRSTACRVLLADPSAARVEHRRAGADANPYVAASALLAAGLRGLTDRLSLPEAGTHPAALPGSLEGAVSQFENATWLADVLGAPFCDTFALTRRDELQRYHHWLQRTITPWEITRHLEHH